jgi:hypothetical protein
VTTTAIAELIPDVERALIAMTTQIPAMQFILALLRFVMTALTTIVTVRLIATTPLVSERRPVVFRTVQYVSLMLTVVAANVAR